MLEVKATIEEVINGEVTQLRIGDDVYLITHIGYYKDVEEAEEQKTKQISKKEVQKEPEPALPLTEKSINKVGGIGIKPSVVKKIMEEKERTIRSIIKESYPHLSSSSLGKYTSSYKSHMMNSEDPLKAVIRKRKSRKRKQPEGTIGFSNTYKTWIREDEHKLIIRALRTYGFKATVKNIKNQTRLSERRVQATLDYMLDAEEVHFDHDMNSHARIYLPNSGMKHRITY